MSALRIGLIGKGIGRSRAPLLHRLAGALCGLDVTYDLFDLAAPAAPDFDAALDACRARGYRGVNVTHPFKEVAAARVQIDSESVRRLGAVNTVLFGEAGAAPRGYNTDYSGFLKAFAARFPGAAPGAVAIVGAGGVGRAIAFALSALGAREIRLYDADAQRSLRLADALGAGGAIAVACDSVAQAAAGADGLVNATPLGMHAHPGSALPRTLIGAQSWAFDAVYTPADTQFLRDARDAGLDVLGGYELFFHQGVDAFELFAGERVDEVRLRDALNAPEIGSA